MKSFLKLTLGLPMIMALSACSFSSSPEQVKSKLEEDNYTVEILDADAYEQAAEYESITTTSGFSAFLSASKAGENDQAGEHLFAWFFDTNDQADTFENLNSISIGDIEVEDGAKLVSGLSNNVVWCGTNAAAKKAGLSIF